MVLYGPVHTEGQAALIALPMIPLSQNNTLYISSPHTMVAGDCACVDITGARVDDNGASGAGDGAGRTGVGISVGNRVEGRVWLSAPVSMASE